LPIVLDRFTTSKITKADDLWSLNTFGFRGEALASIASVSILTLKSRIATSEKAWELKSIFGKKNELLEVGGAPGTSILIEELFGNTPARLKFLKTDTGEISAIRSAMKALALAHSNIEIRYLENGKLYCVWTPCPNSLDRAKQVLQLDQLWFNEIYLQGIHVSAVFSDPKTVARSSKNIWIFVQNRWVQDRGMQAALMDAYRNLLMHGEYPHAVIWLEVDPQWVDVNIHPTKSQVKFQDSSVVFKATQAAFRRGLETAPWLGENISNSILEKPLQKVFEGEIFAQKSKIIEKAAPIFSEAAPVNLNFDSPEFQTTHFQKKNIEIVRNLEWPEENGIVRSELTESHKKNHTLEVLGNEIPSKISNERPLENKARPSQGYWSSLEVIGQIQKTYLVCQDRDRMLLVDQHAAHERVAFEKILASWKGGKIEVQEFLFPLTMELAPEKMELLSTHFSELQRLGIYLEILGPHLLGIHGAPSLIKEKALLLGLEKMSTDLYELGGSFSMEKCIGDVCATLACHSVIRAGQALSLPEMQALLHGMDEFPLSSFCPHGRPVSIEYRFHQIEKDFGRLV